MSVYARRMTGYLTSSGIDLSNIFLSNGGGTFTGAITTNGGIIGPTASITYSQGMIGYTQTVVGNKASVSVPSNTIVSLITNGFTMPIGVYIVIAYVSNTYTGSGSVSFANVGISTSSTAVSAGFYQTFSGSFTAPTGGTIRGSGYGMMQITSNTVYYLLESMIFASIVVTTDSTAENNYVIYTRVA